LDPEIWEVRLHFEGVDNLERRIGHDDVTYMNLLAMRPGAIVSGTQSIVEHLLE
jgi:hypothetical protein